MRNASCTRVWRVLPLLFLLLLLGLFVYFEGYEYISFEMLRQHRFQLLAWTEAHYLIVVGLFMLMYIAAVAASFPGATVLTLAGGFLFGIWLGTLYVVISATLGASIIFLATKTALGDVLSKKAGPFLKKLEQGFQRDAFNYLLVLRLVPLFPFWLLNIVPALLNMRLKPFVVATFFGIIPGSMVYVALGNGLGSIFDKNKTPDLGLIFEPQIFLPFLCLGFLALLPVVFRRFKRKIL